MNWDRFKFESVLFYEIEKNKTSIVGYVVITEKEKGLLVAKYR